MRSNSRRMSLMRQRSYAMRDDAVALRHFGNEKRYHFRIDRLAGAELQETGLGPLSIAVRSRAEVAAGMLDQMIARLPEVRLDPPGIGYRSNQQRGQIDGR